MSAPQHESICVDLKTAAQMLGVSPWTVRAFVHNGQLPAVKLPAVRGTEPSNRRILLAVADLREFVARHREDRP